ncbi:hypothetical protein [Caulobacter sp. Root343]|uniref:hypothetical protein n=1 Tax=Caulobacter sp. Root343 TaxID=1736520 RepID=UPI0006FDA83E|nr:hypothetical protein [Caulobacter sp. Root343]KQV66664.1 hypothetical protein ASC70_12590 [Caulobacter sp. Root343]
MTTALFKAMQPVTADLSRLPLPAWSQEKHDGVGGLVDPVAGLVSKESRPIPNKEARDFLSQRALEGLHGELIAPGGFEAAQAVFMASSGLPPGWRFMVFDLAGSGMPFIDRLNAAARMVDALGAQDVVCISRPRRIRSLASVDDHLAEVVAAGGEGIVLHCGDWGYREGKASATRGESLKVKPTEEAEAEILEVRAREDDQDAAGSVTLKMGGRVFSAPVAMSRTLATRLLTLRANLPGQLGTVRYAGMTRDGAPRCAAFIGVRRDLAA